MVVVPLSGGGLDLPGHAPDALLAHEERLVADDGLGEVLALAAEALHRLVEQVRVNVRGGGVEVVGGEEGVVGVLHVLRPVGGGGGRRRMCGCVGGGGWRSGRRGRTERKREKMSV